jgi:hypothetical protein
MATEVSKFNRQDLITHLTKSKHGDFNSYKTFGIPATQHDPEFLAHLITWNLVKGEIRDSKVALPVIALRNLERTDAVYAENAVANLMSLDPRNLYRAYSFNKIMSADKLTIAGGHRRMLENALKTYLEIREGNRGWWDKTAIQHRASLKALYAVSHKKPSAYAQAVLFERKFPAGSVFHKIANMKSMPAQEAAGVILNNRLPAQIVMGALGRTKEDLIKDRVLIMALLEGMSGQQLVNSTKFLQSLGVMSDPVLSSEYAKALERAKGDKKMSTLKAGVALKAIKEANPDDAVTAALVEKLSQVQEARVSAKCSIDGDWVILGDMSGSMSRAVTMAVEIASLIARSVTGKVYLIFFNTAPRLFDVTGKTLEEIQKACAGIRAGGGTSCGCGLKYLEDRNIAIQGIAHVGDGGDNSNPFFHEAYKSYAKKFGYDPTTYFFKLTGDRDAFSIWTKSSGIDVETFDLSSMQVDHYSIPNLVASMKVMKYSLADEIFDTPLLTLNDVFTIK